MSGASCRRPTTRSNLLPLMFNPDPVFCMHIVVLWCHNPTVLAARASPDEDGPLAELMRISRALAGSGQGAG